MDADTLSFSLMEMNLVWYVCLYFCLFLPFDSCSIFGPRKTVDGCLVFAGEATSLGSSGTIHSAMETGARAAGEVIRLAGLHPALMARL